MKNKISIIIPFYNVSDYLAEAIESVLNQKNIDSEIILVDDGSSDGSHEIAIKYEKKYSNILLITQVNKGLGAARNTGADAASGEYITFVDSDDLVIEDVYYEMLEQINSSGSDFIVGNVSRWNQKGIWMSGLHKHAFQKTISGVNIHTNPELINDTTAWNKIFRRSFWEQHSARFPESVLYEDIPIILPLYLHATIDVYSKLMYLWRSRPAGDASITQSHDYQNIHDRMLAVNHVYSVYSKEAVDLLSVYHHKVLTNDFQIYLKEFYKQDPELFDYVYSQVNIYLKNVDWEILSGLSLHLRLQYTFIKKDNKEKLLEYLRSYRKGETVNVGIVKNGELKVANRYSHYLPESLLFSDADSKVTATLVTAHVADNHYWLNMRQRIPFLFIKVPKLNAKLDTVDLDIQPTFTKPKKWLIEMFAANEAAHIDVLQYKGSYFKKLFGQLLYKFIGDDRYRKMRLSTRRPNLPFMLKIPIDGCKNAAVSIFARWPHSKQISPSKLDVIAERSAIRTMPVKIGEKINSATVNSEWEFQISNTDGQIKQYGSINEAIPVNVNIENNKFLLSLDDQLVQVSDYLLRFQSNRDVRDVILDSDGKYHIPNDMTERKYSVYLVNKLDNKMYPVGLGKTSNHSFEQTVYTKERCMQLQHKQLADTLLFKQWEPLNWYEATALRRQAFRGLVYPLLRKLPLKNIFVYGSFWGRNFSDNPRAVYQYAHDNELKYQHVALLYHNLGQYKEMTDITFVKPGSFKYYYYLARAKYLFNNVNFDSDYRKRNNQIEVQTMHGTPLKKLGLDSPGEIAVEKIPEYVDKNRRWDYLTVPSDYVSRISLSAFDHTAKILKVGYPRNDELFNNNNDEYINNLKDKLGVPRDKKIVLYAPTWRKKGEFIPQIDFENLRNQVDDDIFVILKLHQFMSVIEVDEAISDFVKVVSNEIEISNLYLISDVLITDYSSVMFDYAVLKRPMIFYVYDYDKYSQDMRPLYFDFKSEAPGALAYTEDDLIDALNKVVTYESDYKEYIQQFRRKFVQYDDGNANKNLLKSIGAQDD